MKLTKKFLTALLAAMLLINLTAAALATNGNESAVLENTRITKIWNSTSREQLNDTEVFEFVLTYTGVDKLESNDTGEPSKQEQKIDITANWKTNAQEMSDGTYSSSATATYAELFKDITFSAPGIYSFQLKETDKGNPSIEYSSTVYTIKVYVGRAVDGATNHPTENTEIFFVETLADGEKTAADFTGTVKPTGSLSVTAFVTGNAANINDEFKFAIVLQRIDGSYTADTKENGTLVQESGNITAVTASEGKTTIQITLRHGQTYEIYNLPAEAEYLVTEVNTQNYTTSVTINDGPVNSGNTTGLMAINTGADVIFTNNKEIASPTGVFTDAAPFVIMLATAIFGLITIFAMRRRRDH